MSRKKETKKNKSKKSSRKIEKDPMIEHLEKELEKDLRYIAWLKENISSIKAKIAQNRKILEKLRTN